MVYEDFIWWDDRGKYTSPVVSAIVYKEGDYAVAKVWNEQWGRWSRIAKSTDHAGVIKSAIDHVANAGGGKVIIKKGTYAFLFEVDISGISNLVIEHEKGTVLYPVGDHAIYNSANADQRNVKICGGIIDGKKDLGYTSYMISFGGTGIKEHIEICNVTFKNCDKGIWANGGATADSNFKYAHIHDLYFENCTYGFNSTGIKSCIIENIIGIEIDRVLVFPSGNTAYPRPYASDCVIRNITAINSTPRETLVVDATRSARMIIENIVGINVLKLVNGEPFYDPGSGQPEDHNIIKNMYGINVARAAVKVTYGEGTRIENVYIENVSTDGQLSYAIGGNISNGLIRGCTIKNAYAVGISLGASSHNTKIIENTIINPGQGGTYTYGIFINDADNVIISKNRILDEQTTPTMTHGVYLSGTPTNYIITENIISGATIVAIRKAGTGIIKKNVGYPTENSGTATIPAGSTSVTVNHGLVDTPSKVHVTPLSDPGTYWYVTNITSTSFDIVLASAPSSDVTFSWYAEV